MKAKIYLTGLALVVVFLVGCKKDNNELIDDMPPGPPGFVVVVQMPEAQQTQMAIIGHPIISVDRSTGQEIPIFNENVLEPKLSYFSDTWLKDTLKILEHSPYVELCDNYYLIDWRWRNIHPFGTRAIPCPSWLISYTAFIEHWFVTDVKWGNINVIQDWSSVDLVGHPAVTDIVDISNYELDNHFNTLIPKSSPYWLGVYWMGGPDVDVRQQNQVTAAEYITFLDTLQERYRTYLIQLIQAGELKTFYK